MIDYKTINSCLETGKTYKSFKVILNLLGENTEVKGKQRQGILEKFNKYVSYVKQVNPGM